MYAVITDFSLQLQGCEKTGTELGMDRRCRCRTPMPLDRRGRSHTKWRDRHAALVPVRLALAPVPASWAAAARERPRSRRMPRCTLIATVPALRCAPRSGHLGDECAAMACTCARALAPGDKQPCLGTCMPGCTRLRLGAPAGAATAYTRHAGEGCAGRFATWRGVARACCAAPSRTATGSGCPLRPRGDGVEGRALRLRASRRHAGGSRRRRGEPPSRRG